jgi:hypothetical protein
MENIENNIKTKPTGGFPPLYICNKEKLKKDEDGTKIRGFAKEEQKVVATLKDIMQERRKEKEPFIIL